MSSIRRILWVAVVAVCIPVGLVGLAQAGCRYVLVSFHFLECREVTASEVAQEERTVDQLPGVDSVPPGKQLRVRCGCEYTLSGSDPRCDFEHSEEQESLLRVEERARNCKKGKPLCKSVCPPEWTD
ncbi:MAG: hypothetical protein WC859_04535 [Elusimicrobiota bacterium]|jgi:hypothetical protein